MCNNSTSKLTMQSAPTTSPRTTQKVMVPRQTRAEISRLGLFMARLTPAITASLKPGGRRHSWRPFSRKNVEPSPRATQLAYMFRIVISIYFSEISESRSAASRIGSYSSLRPSRIISKMVASAKLSPMCASSSRC